MHADRHRRLEPPLHVRRLGQELGLRACTHAVTATPPTLMLVRVSGSVTPKDNSERACKARCAGGSCHGASRMLPSMRPDQRRVSGGTSRRRTAGLAGPRGIAGCSGSGARGADSDGGETSPGRDVVEPGVGDVGGLTTWLSGTWSSNASRSAPTRSWTKLSTCPIRGGDVETARTGVGAATTMLAGMAPVGSALEGLTLGD